MADSVQCNGCIGRVTPEVGNHSYQIPNTGLDIRLVVAATSEELSPVLGIFVETSGSTAGRSWWPV